MLSKLPYLALLAYAFALFPPFVFANPTPDGTIASNFPVLTDTSVFVPNPKTDPGPKKIDAPKLNLDIIKINDGFKKIDWAKIQLPPIKEETFTATPALSGGTLKTPITIPISASKIFVPELLQTPKSFYDARLLAIKNNISPILKQAGASDAKAAELASEATPLFDEILRAIFSEQDVSFEDSSLVPRSIFGSIWRKIKDVFSDGACAVTAGVSLPGFLFSAAMFDANNNHGFYLSKDQKFFVAALHGNLYREPIVVYYQATRAPGFSARASTFGKDIYTVDLPITSCVTPGFRRTMQLLLHETVHTLQYRDRGWSLSSFGWDYLFHYCKAGMSYSKNPFETEAYARQEWINNLLLDHTGWGQKFFQFWISNSLDSKIGYPAERNFKEISSTPSRISELRFENGAMQITHKNGNYCYRTLTLAEANAREYNGCKLIKSVDCKTLDEIPERKRNILKERSPSPVAEPKPVPTDPRGKPRRCTASELKERNRPCQEIKDAWARGDRTPWACGTPWTALG